VCKGIHRGSRWTVRSDGYWLEYTTELTRKVEQEAETIRLMVNAKEIKMMATRNSTDIEQLLGKCTCKW